MKQRIGIDYDNLFRSLPGAYLVMAIDDPAFTIVEVNDSLSTLSGMTRDEMLNLPLTTVYPESDDSISVAGTQALIASVRRCIRDAKPDSTGIIRYDIKDADGVFVPRYWKTTNYPIVKSGKVTGVILSTEDVTVTYTNETYAQQRIEYLEHLVAINESKDEFISVASHQLRTPATAVKQYLGMLLSGMFGTLEASQQDLLERANESNERQLRIVADLLKVAQVDAGKLTLRKERIDINQLVAQVIQEQTDSFQKRGQLVIVGLSKNPAIASVDSNIIRMVIENIIDNASKYTEDNKVITVTVKCLKNTVKIIVQDEGVGISPEQMGKLFEKFSRIDNTLSTKVGGTGLGLYWAKKSVELHNGTLVYGPADSRGSIFTITLPTM